MEDSIVCNICDIVIVMVKDRLQLAVVEEQTGNTQNNYENN
jgi:uncharacterized membrane protein YqjE